ncbi:MAG: hypothetical protein FWD68_00425 [Alphaproteobacteria bacterium]|nr:hypothetical protein [Alphaproteobacteria bacterium]
MSRHQRLCATCGREFTALSPRTVTCSPACNRELQRRRTIRKNGPWVDEMMPDDDDVIDRLQNADVESLITNWRADLD